MTNDNDANHAKREKFRIGLNELIAMVDIEDADAIPVIKAKLAELRLNVLPSKHDDEVNAAGGLPPWTDEQKRQYLHLDPWEPIPAQRTCG